MFDIPIWVRVYKFCEATFVQLRQLQPAVNNSSGFCICLSANNTSITENHQPVASNITTVHETENTQSDDAVSIVTGQKRRLSEQWEDDLKNSIINLEQLIEKRELELKIWKKKKLIRLQNIWNNNTE